MIKREESNYEIIHRRPHRTNHRWPALLHLSNQRRHHPIFPPTPLGALSFVSWLIVAFFTIIIVTTFAYSLATIGLLGPIAATPGGGVLPISPLEQFMRGLLIGLASALNFSIWAITTRHSLLGLTIGIILLISGFMAVFVVFSRNPLYQTMLGWSSWLRPLSWLMTVPGFLLFLDQLASSHRSPWPSWSSALRRHHQHYRIGLRPHAPPCWCRWF